MDEDLKDSARQISSIDCASNGRGTERHVWLPNGLGFCKCGKNIFVRTQEGLPVKVNGEAVPPYYDRLTEGTSETCNRPMPCSVHEFIGKLITDLEKCDPTASAGYQLACKDIGELIRRKFKDIG